MLVQLDKDLLVAGLHHFNEVDHWKFVKSIQSPSDLSATPTSYQFGLGICTVVK